MASKPREYTRLPGTGFLSQGRIPVALLSSRLYLGPDHLLRVENSRFQESYRRFYFADIQSIVSVYTKTWLGWLAFWIFLLLCASPGIFLPLRGPDPTPGVAIFTGIPAVFIFVLLVRALARGRSCRTEILTPGGREIIPSLGRRRATRRALEKIMPPIAQAQSTLPVALSSEWEFALEEANREPAPSSAHAPGAQPPPLLVRAPSGWLLWTAPLLAIITALIFLAFTISYDGWFLVGGLTLGVFLLIPAIAALVRLPKIAGGLRGINVAIALIGIAIGISYYIAFIASTVQSTVAHRRQVTGIVDLASHFPFSPEAQVALAYTFAGLAGLTGLAGLPVALALLRRFKPPLTANS